jgi:hypothetical protein
VKSKSDMARSLQSESSSLYTKKSHCFFLYLGPQGSGERAHIAKGNTNLFSVLKTQSSSQFLHYVILLVRARSNIKIIIRQTYFKMIPREQAGISAMILKTRPLYPTFRMRNIVFGILVFYPFQQ